MRFLLDTHSLIWSLFAPEKLSKIARNAIVDPENEVMVSVITFWEISLKYALGKFEIIGLNPEDLPVAAHKTGFDIIQVEPDEAASFHRLPRLGHKDPFDRLILWQAIQRKLTLLSADHRFQEYKENGLRVLW